MDNREISLLMDERWCAALESATGMKMEELLLAHMDTLKLSLPQVQRDAITAEIQREEQQRAVEQVSNRRFSVYHIIKHGKTEYYALESQDSFIDVANKLRVYLDSGKRSEVLIHPNDSRISRGRYDQYCADLLFDSARVTKVYCIDMDNEVVSTLDRKDGWRSYLLKDVSEAAAHTDLYQTWWDRSVDFYRQLEGKELLHEDIPIFIRGSDSLPVDNLRFVGDVEQIEHLLKFRVPVTFDPHGVFGIHVTEDENDAIKLHASYDMERDYVCDTLDVHLMRGDGTELMCAYLLTTDEQDVLCAKMDAYCVSQMALSLEDAREQYLSEEQKPFSTAQFISQVESIREESHQKVDARCDALIRKTVLGESAAGRIVPLRDDLSSLKGEKPSAVVLPNKEIIPVKTWRQAVAIIMRDCAADPVRRERLMELRGKVNGNFRSLLRGTPDSMDVPLEITEGLYMEGKFDTSALLRMLTKKVLPHTGYDYQSVLFQLREQTQQQVASQERAEMEPTQLSEQGITEAVQPVEQTMSMEQSM